MKKKSEYSVIVNVNLEFIIKAKDAKEAEALMFDVELPKEYVEDSFEIVKVIDKK